MKEVRYSPIGVVHSPYRQPSGTPVQPTAAKDVRGTVEIFPEYVEGLKDMKGFSHIVLLYHFHLSKGCSLLVKPYMDVVERGVFATRAPRRPNPIGLSVVRLDKIEGNKLDIRDVDIVDGTPLLDIKPHVPQFDLRSGETRIGWLEKRVRKLPRTRDNGRFST
jgi:tRNA-Thr(GGU) m(6)t(6)A37 methyltransferase TsaA